MLRMWVFLLVLGNGAFFAWSQGFLGEFSAAPLEQREPERLTQQVAPERLRLIAADTKTAAAVPEPTACYQASGFAADQLPALREGLATLAWAQPTRWAVTEQVQPPRWLVYMGRFPDAAALGRKKTELRTLKIEFRDAPQALMPGLILGTYSLEANAQAGLKVFVKKGVRTARVVQERAEQRSYTLRLDAITPAQHNDVKALSSALAGRALEPC